MSMNESRIVIAQFCDDIRHEIGNKYSLMGCYGDEMILDKFPAMLPKLCVQVRVLTPVDQPFTKLLIRAVLNGENIAEIDVPAQKMAQSYQDRVALPPDAHRHVVVAIIAISPLPVSEPCQLKIEAETETEDGVLRGSSLRIRERTADDPPLQRV